MNEFISTELGEVNKDFSRFKIEDISIKMADAPFGSSIKNYDYTSAGVVVVQGNNINGRKCDWSSLRFVDEEKYKSLPRSHCFIGDLVFPKVGTIGKVGILTKYDLQEKYLLSTNTMMLRADPEKADQHFVYYYFSSRRVREYIELINANSVQPVFNFTSLKNFPIYLPTLPEQKSIAAILCSLDDKIELLHRQNTTLETLAETLFRQWFVEEAGESWKAGRLGDVIELVYGKALKEELRVGSGFPVVGSSGVVGYHGEFLVEGPGIVIGRKGTLGRVIYLFENFFPIDTTYFIKSKVNSVGLFYEYFLLKTLNFEEMNSDSAVPGLNRDLALSTEIKIAPFDKLKQYNDSCASLFEKLKTNNVQIRTLARLRDTLLPKLMSGEVRVSS